MDLAVVGGLPIATFGGAAIGLDRQWSGPASGPQARFGASSHSPPARWRASAGRLRGPMPSLPEYQTAGVALATGILPNTLLKLTVASVVGRGAFR